MIDPQLRHAIAHRLGIAGVAKRQAPDADVDAGSGDSVSQSRKPFGVGFGLLDLDHLAMYPVGNELIKSDLRLDVDSNLRPHPKQEVEKLSELVEQSLLGRQ